MMLTRACRFTAFPFIVVILISWAMTLPSYASMDEDDPDRNFIIVQSKRERTSPTDQSFIDSSRDNHIKSDEDVSYDESSSDFASDSYSQKEPLDDADIIIDLEGDYRQTNDQIASSSVTSRKIIIAGYGSLDNSTSKIKPTSQTSRYEVKGDKPTYLLMFLGQNYLGIHKPGMITDENITNYESAMVFNSSYTGPNPHASNWDELNLFMQEADKYLLNIEKSNLSTAAEVVGFIVGLIPSIPSTGTVVSSVGDFFHIPAGKTFSITLAVWTLCTTAPSFAMNLASRCRTIIDTLQEKNLYPKRSVNNESKPCVIESSRKHKALIGLLIFAAGLDATVNVGVVARAYLEHFPGTFYGTGWAYFLSWMEGYYRIGREKIDRVYCETIHDTALSHKKRSLLLDALEKCQKVISEEDLFVQTLYKKIFGKINEQHFTDEEANPETVFALSAFFLQAANTMNFDATNAEEKFDETSQLIAENARLGNFQTQQDHNLSIKEEFLDQLSTFLVGAAVVGRAVTMEYVLEKLLIHIFSASPSSATAISWSASLFDVIFRSFTEGDIQKEYMRGWLNTFSLQHLGDFQWLRKISSLFSVTNGSLFALAKTVAGITAFDTWGVSIPIKIICLLPAFLQDQAYYGTIFAEGSNKLITNVATFKAPPKNAHINVQRAWLMKWSRKVHSFIKYRFDKETIGKLYSIILKGF